MSEIAADQRLLARTPASLSASFFAGSDRTDPGVVTVTVTRADGSALKPAGTPTAGSGNAARTLALSAVETADLDLLTCTWVSATEGTFATMAEIVGGRIFGLAEARAFDAGQVADQAAYPDAALETVRARIEDEFQSITGVSFIPRYRRVVLDPLGPVAHRAYPWPSAWVASRAVQLPDHLVSTVRSVELRDGSVWTPLTQDELDDLIIDGNLLVRDTTGLFSGRRQSVRVAYEYGYSGVPLDIRRAALRVLVSGVGATSSNLPANATSMSTELGTFALITPGVRGAWYPDAEVNRILGGYLARMPAIG